MIARVLTVALGIGVAVANRAWSQDGILVGDAARKEIHDVLDRLEQSVDRVEYSFVRLMRSRADGTIHRGALIRLTLARPMAQSDVWTLSSAPSSSWTPSLPELPPEVLAEVRNIKTRDLPPNRIYVSSGSQALVLARTPTRESHWRGTLTDDCKNMFLRPWPVAPGLWICDRWLSTYVRAASDVRCQRSDGLFKIRCIYGPNEGMATCVESMIDETGGESRISLGRIQWEPAASRREQNAVAFPFAQHPLDVNLVATTAPGVGPDDGRLIRVPSTAQEGAADAYVFVLDSRRRDDISLDDFDPNRLPPTLRGQGHDVVVLDEFTGDLMRLGSDPSQTHRLGRAPRAREEHERSQGLDLRSLLLWVGVAAMVAGVLLWRTSRRV